MQEIKITVLLVIKGSMIYTLEKKSAVTAVEISYSYSTPIEIYSTSVKKI